MRAYIHAIVGLLTTACCQASTGLYMSCSGSLPSASPYNWTYHDSLSSFEQPFFQSDDNSSGFHYIGDGLQLWFKTDHNGTSNSSANSATRYWRRTSADHGSFSFDNGFSLVFTGICNGTDSSAPGCAVVTFDSIGRCAAIVWKNVTIGGGAQETYVKIMTNASDYSGSNWVKLNDITGGYVDQGAPMTYTLTVDANYVTLRINSIKVLNSGSEVLKVAHSSYRSSSGNYSSIWFGDGSTGASGNMYVNYLSYSGS